MCVDDVGFGTRMARIKSAEAVLMGKSANSSDAVQEVEVKTAMV